MGPVGARQPGSAADPDILWSDGDGCFDAHIRHWRDPRDPDWHPGSLPAVAQRDFVSDDAPTTGSRTQLLLPLLAVAAMLVVIVLHQLNVRVNHLAHDLGGGFGMFAFIDNSEWRAVQVTVESIEGTIWTFDLEQRAPDLELTPTQVQRVRGAPSDGALAATADLVRTRGWVVDDAGGLRVAEPGDPETIAVAEVRIVVAGVTYDPDANEARRIVITQWPDAQ